MIDLFLSYKAEDRQRVALIVDALQADGLPVWWDQHIKGGDQWRETILARLEAARAVVVVWSKRSIGPAGSFVRDEATRALRRGSYIPVRIDKVDPPLGFGETQAFDLRGWKGERSNENYQALLAALKVRLGSLDSRGVPSVRRAIPLGRRTLLAGGAAVLAAAGVGAWRFLRPGQGDDHSIAVLPFGNLSGDPSQNYFSDGIAEELRSVLARIPGMKVVARTSSEAVRGMDAVAVATKLHVRNILTGSVRRSPQMIRISAQLIDGLHGTELWSEVYDRPFGDMLQIQTEIATMVAQSLSIHLEGAGKRALKEGGTENAQAQDLYLQAEGVAWRSDGPSSLRRAMEFVDRALALDPRYADAIAAKAAIMNSLGSFFASSAEDGRAKSDAARKLASQAIAIAPESALAHAALANTLWNTLRLREGLAEFQQAAKSTGGSISFFSGFDPYALALACSRRFDAALARSEQLVATDPLNPNAFLTKAVVLLDAGQYAESYDAATQAIALGRELRWPRAFQALSLMQMGRLAEAKDAFDAIPGTGPWLSMAASLAERQGRHEDANRLVAIMRKEMGDAGYYQYAETFAQQGRIDEAIAALEDGWRARDPGLVFINVDVLLDPLRNDRRFQNIVKRLDFPGPN